MIEFSTFSFHLSSMIQQTGLPMETVCRTLYDLGFRGLDAGLDVLSAEYLETLYRSGLKLTLIYFTPDYLTEDGVRQAEQALTLARQYGVRRLMPIPRENAARLEECLSVTFRELNKLGEQLKNTDIRMVLEDFDCSGRSITTIRGLQRYYDAVPSLGVCFDTGNFRGEGDSLEKGEKLYLDSALHVHLKDRLSTGECCPVGQGILDLGHVVRKLLKNGYDGVFALEHGGPFDQFHAAADSIRCVREWVGRNL